MKNIRTFYRANRAALFLFGGVLLCYPLLWTGSRHFDWVVLFGHGALTLTALLLLSFSLPATESFFRSPRARWIGLALIPAAAAALYHALRTGGANLALEGLYYPAIFLLGAVCFRQFARTLPYFLALLGLCDIDVLVRNWFASSHPMGLAGNWNWSFSLLALGLAALVFLFNRGRFFFFGAAAAIPLTLVFGNGAYFARATALAVAGAGLVLLLRRCTKRMRGALAALLLVAAVLTAGWWAGAILRDDVRPYLAAGALSVIAGHPVAGAGPGLFESAVAPELPAAYHGSKFASSRHPHAHNQLLQLGAELGLGGMILIAALAAAACFAFARQTESDEERKQISFALFTFVLLLIHGQLDVLLSAWPTDSIFLIAAGILWGYGAEMKTAPDIPEPKPKASPLLVSLRLLLAAALAAVLSQSFAAGIYGRRALLAGERGDKTAMTANWQRSIDIRPDARNLYGAAAHALYDLKNPALALERLDRLRNEAFYENYLHNHSLRGRALCVLGKYDEALAAFEREQRNFPESAVNQAMKAEVFGRLNRKEEQRKAIEELSRTMERKNLPLQALPILFRNPEWDVNASYFDRKLLEKTK